LFVLELQHSQNQIICRCPIVFGFCRRASQIS
jgi:hypothetical protein